MENLYHESWNPILTPLLQDSKTVALFDFLKLERQSVTVFPAPHLMFNAFLLTPFQDIKVVILGQDPYHGPGQAHGLSFSVPAGIALPPSLRNIFTELTNDIQGFHFPSSGDLTSWAQQGVLLLNATLTVRAHEAGSHQKKGWEEFTDQIIKTIAEKHEHVVFILWGAYAQKKATMIDAKKHLILKSAHPSPLSVYRGFWNSKPFSQANKYLQENGRAPINWLLG